MSSEIKSESKSRDILKKGMDILLPIIVSGVMVGWLFHKADPREILHIIRNSCDYRWLLAMCVVEVISRVVRGLRWGIQLRAAGVSRMPVMAEISSIFGSFTLNLLLTGVGEAWRCIYVSRRQKAPLSTVIGTDIGDRISDAFMIMLIIGVSLIVARPVIDRFMDTYRLGRGVIVIIESPWLWIGLSLLAGIFLYLMLTHSRNPRVVKIRKQIAALWHGFRILFTMRHQVRFWSYTLIIWIAYFLMTYLCFFAFPFTRELIRPDLAYGLLPGLIVFVFASVSIAIPASGGLGPWNMAVIFALSLYGIGNADATAYSMVVWAFQSATQVMMGLIAAAYISIGRRHQMNPTT